MTALVLQPADVQSGKSPRTFLIGLLLLWSSGLLTASGCQESRLGHVPASFRDYHEAGMAVIGSTYEFDATTTVKSTRPVLITLKSNQARRYEGRDIYPDFRVYANPSDRTEHGGRIEVKFSVPAVDIISGWALLVGTSPMGKTTRVRAVGEGTVMIIEVDDSTVPAIHRVYLVGEDHSVAHIYVPPEPEGLPPISPDLTPGTYGEIQDLDGAEWRFMGRYKDVQARLSFVQRVLESGQDVAFK